MDIQLKVVPATASDAGLISRILARSFKTGCAVDHRNNATLVDAWTRRHSTDQISAWLADSSLHVQVAWLAGKPVGVGMVRSSGQIDLCYVLPEFFRRGVGQGLMLALEQRLARLGKVRAVLYSTLTGQGFYERMGYRENGQAQRASSLPLRPMHKPLSMAAIAPVQA